MVYITPYHSTQHKHRIPLKVVEVSFVHKLWRFLSTPPVSSFPLAACLKKRREDEHTDGSDDRCWRLADHHSSLLLSFSLHPRSSHLLLALSPTRLTEQVRARFLRHLSSQSPTAQRSHTPALAAGLDAAFSSVRLGVEENIMVAEGEELVVVQGPGKACSLESWLGHGGLVISLVVKYTCLLCCNPREKSSVEEEIKEKEEAIRQRSTEVQVRSLCEILPVF